MRNRIALNQFTDDFVPGGNSYRSFSHVAGLELACCPADPPEYEHMRWYHCASLPANAANSKGTSIITLGTSPGHGVEYRDAEDPAIVRPAAAAGLRASPMQFMISALRSS